MHHVVIEIAKSTGSVYGALPYIGTLVALAVAAGGFGLIQAAENSKSSGGWALIGAAVLLALFAWVELPTAKSECRRLWTADTTTYVSDNCQAIVHCRVGGSCD
jgi:drug/metabolite transporter superfamily protein YnfA